jgi:hypothetical protein
MAESLTIATSLGAVHHHQNRHRSLSSAYRKLIITSRYQLAAAMTAAQISS